MPSEDIDIFSLPIKFNKYIKGKILMEKMNVRKIVLMFADAFIVLLSGVLTSFILSFFYFWTNPMLGRVK